MTTKYLLPCECGEKLEVDSSQSGLSLPCPCGATLQVPALRGLRKLEPVAAAAAPSGATWGPRQGMCVVGLLVAVVAGGVGIWFAVSPPRHPSEQQAKLLISDDVPIMATIELWRQIKEEGLSERPTPELATYRQALTLYRIYTTACFVVGGLGLLLIPASYFFFPSRPPAPRRAAAPARPRR